MTGSADSPALSDGVRLDPPREGFPPLLVVYQNRLTVRAIENLRESWKSAWDGPPYRPVLMDGNPVIYQLLDGRWQPLSPSVDDAPQG